MEDPNVLDAVQVAGLLGVNKATVYKLVREGSLSSFNVGRKLRFTTDDVIDFQQRMRKGTREAHDASSRHGQAAAETSLGGEVGDLLGQVGFQSFSIGGRDPVLDALTSSLVSLGLDVPRSYRASYQSLIEVYLGATQAAAINLWDAKSDTYNVPYIMRLLPGTPAIVFTLARVNQGLLVAQGNPNHIRNWEDLLRDDIALANREKGAGPRVLLDEHLIMLEADHYQVRGYDRELSSSLAAAHFIARGSADVGVGDERIYHQVSGLDFLPQQISEIALVVRKNPQNERVIRLLRGLLISRDLHEELGDIPGYDLSRMGRVIYEV